MKKITLLIITVLMMNIVHAQDKVEKLEEYTASNGITYKVGDEIKLGRGSDTNGKFVYVNIGGWGMSTDAETNRLGAANSGLIVTVKKIKSYNYKRYKGVYFTVGGGNLTNYNLDIENAIATCEIEDCKKEGESAANSTTDKYDQLKKLKQLFDDGILTEEEYNVEKKKLLETN